MTDTPTHPILIVEDNAVNLLILRSVLRKNGYEPLVANDGVEGVAMARAHLPKLILMDLHMPRMDGFAAAEEIWRQPGCEDVAIVAVTANLSEEHQRLCTRSGFAGLIGKPLDFDELIEVVRRWV